MKALFLTGVMVTALLGACSDNTVSKQDPSHVVSLLANENFAESLQKALIMADPGTLIQLPAGTFEFTDGLSLDVQGVRLQGAGQGKTILDFKGQQGAGEGLLVTSNDVILSDFTMRDTAGDGIKSKGADRIIYRDLTVEWSGTPDKDNGAYAVYPVESEHVLIENVTVRGASDAGIYVGQSKNIIVRNSLAEYNVAGIEIENSSFADVYGNTTQNNTGGILVFDLPNLPVMGGHSTRIFDNDVKNNNTPNFAPVGNIVASVPSGTGIMIMANENVHVFENRFANNQSVQVIVNAYINEFEDASYNPLPRNIAIYDNEYSGGGDKPQGLLGEFAKSFGGRMAALVWDGATSWDGGDVVDVNLSINEADNVTFLSLGLGSYPVVEANIKPSPFRPKASALPAPAPIKLPHDH